VEVQEPAGGSGPGVPGRATVLVSDQKRQLIGVKTAPVVKRPLVRTIRAVGRVAYDETRLQHVHTKGGGGVETVHASTTGQMVRRGEPLLTLYSPELLAAAQEYLLALKAKDSLAASTLPAVRDGAEELVASARRRLLLLDLTPRQIEELQTKGEA